MLPRERSLQVQTRARRILPERQPARYGLGLCNPNNVILPREQAELDRDMAQLQSVRREAESKSGSIRLS